MCVCEGSQSMGERGVRRGRGRGGGNNKQNGV